MDVTSIAERLPDLVILLAEDDGLLQISDGWEDVFGPPKPEPGTPIHETALGSAIGPRVCALLSGHLNAVRLGLRVESLVLPIVDSRGDRRTLQGHAHRNPRGLHPITLVLRDVSAPWQQIVQMIESENRFVTAANATKDMVTETDFRSGRFTYVSWGTRAVLGYLPEQLIGTLAVDLHHPEDLPGFLHDVRSRSGSATFTVRPHRLRRSDGSWVWVEATGIRYRGADGRGRVVGVARDITARLEAENVRVELEAQLQRSQRVESLGVLAGGIAHDFNNLLTPILGSASVAAGAESLDREALLKRLETIRNSARRAKALTDQMLDYAGRAAVRRTIIDLSETVREMELLLETTASRAVTLVCEFEEHLAIEADANQVGQILMNLVANAAEAAKPEGGRIEVRTFSLEANRSELDALVLGDQLEAGAFACLEVSDSGCGMEAETRERVFDPFFTTKFTGRGLGLAVVLGIIRRHGAAVEVRSEIGEGCRFRVLFPLLAEGARGVAATTAPKSPAKIPQLSGTLLVVDDDDGARDLTSTLLRRASFQIYEASNGAQAVEIFRNKVGELSGVVLDSTMPGMSGAGTFEAIREIEPAVRVLLVSGYTSHRDAEALLGRGVVGFLQKPFEPEELLRAVGELLENGPEREDERA